MDMQQEVLLLSRIDTRTENIYSLLLEALCEHRSLDKPLYEMIIAGRHACS
jgi:hypothetical protein